MSPAGFTVSPPGPNCAHTLDGGNGNRGRGKKSTLTFLSLEAIS